jgi:hypothetical protein
MLQRQYSASKELQDFIATFDEGNGNSGERDENSEKYLEALKVDISTKFTSTYSIE